MSNTRLEMLLRNRGGELQDKDLVDCYNQTYARGTSYTITTRINASNHYYVYEIVYSAGNE